MTTTTTIHRLPVVDSVRDHIESVFGPFASFAIDHTTECDSMAYGDECHAAGCVAVVDH